MNLDSELMPTQINKYARDHNSFLGPLAKTLAIHKCMDEEDVTFTAQTTRILQVLKGRGLDKVLLETNVPPVPVEGEVPRGNTAAQLAAQMVYWRRKNNYLIEVAIIEDQKIFLKEQLLSLFHPLTWEHVTTALPDTATPKEIWECAMAKHHHYIANNADESEAKLKAINFKDKKYQGRDGVTKMHSDFNNQLAALRMIQENCDLQPMSIREASSILSAAYDDHPAFNSVQAKVIDCNLNPATAWNEELFRQIQRIALAHWDKHYLQESKATVKHEAHAKIAAAPKEKKDIKRVFYFSNGSKSHFSGPPEEFDPDYWKKSASRAAARNGDHKAGGGGKKSSMQHRHRNKQRDRGNHGGGRDRNRSHSRSRSRSASNDRSGEAQRGPHRSMKKIEDWDAYTAKAPKDSSDLDHSRRSGSPHPNVKRQKHGKMLRSPGLMTPSEMVSEMDSAKKVN